MNDALPLWARDLRTLYESGAANQFVLHGNVHDRLVLPDKDGVALGTLTEFLQRVLLARFDVVLTYDVGNGIRIEKGGKLFEEWPTARGKSLPKAPRAAVDTLTHYFRYCANLRALGQRSLHVALIVREAQLVSPRTQGAASDDRAATAVLVRDWSAESALVEHPLATFVIAENLNDLHTLVANNPRAAQVNVPLPSPDDLSRAFDVLRPSYEKALARYVDDLDHLAEQLAGASLGAVEGLLRAREHRGEELVEDDLVDLKKALVEKDSAGLVDFVESDKTLDDIHGQDAVTAWLRQDIELWRQGDTQAIPMGYLLCGPVGTGKTYLVKCLAGEAGVPVVKIKNFRDKWIGSSEGNLEKIFRLLHALGRCVVFIDEADQALGRRGQSSGDSGLSGRIYSMIAQEMSRTENRGRIVWVLASSRPDMIEVDLKRPGRIDVRIPLFPTTDVRAAGALIRALCKRRGLALSDADLGSLSGLLPDLLTPGGAEALAVKAYRNVRTRGLTPVEAVRECLDGYQSPVPPEVMEFQIRLALAEASDLDLVPRAICDRFS